MKSTKKSQPNRLNSNFFTASLSSQIPVIEGVYGASLTPMHPDFGIHEEEFAAHCKDLMNRGCSGVAVFGTTGEGFSFSVAEKKKAIESLITRGIDPQKLILGIICCPISDAVEMTKISIKHGCLAILLAPPFFYQPIDDEGVIAFYREIILRVENKSLKIILYHIPQFTGVPITLNVIKKLYAEFPDQVIGVKESEGNFSFTKEILKKNPGFKVFLGGQEQRLPEAVSLGVSGTITGLANIFPELIDSLYAGGENQSKADVSAKMQEILKVFQPYSFLPAFKSILEKRRGTAWHALRPPLLPLNDVQRGCLNESLDQIFHD